MIERLLEDMVTLCNGVMEEFDYADWFNMLLEDRMKWCSRFATEHARLIDPSDLRERLQRNCGGW